MKDDFKIDITAIAAQVKQQAEKSLETSIHSTANDVARGLMNSGRYGGKEGLAHEIIRKKVEDFILSDRFGVLIDAAIEEVAPEEIKNATRILVGSKTRKVMFTATEESNR